MSGGSMDYLYLRVDEVADELLRSQDPLRAAFGKRLKLVADALYAVEWVDSGDLGIGDDADAIRAALAPGDALEMAVERAQAAALQFVAELTRENP